MTGCQSPAPLAGAEADSASPGERTLRFLRDGEPAGELALSALRDACGESRIPVDDPYYGRPMAFHALPLPCVLREGFGAEDAALRGVELLLRARDGYTRPVAGSALLDCCAHLAFGDVALEPDPDRAARRSRWEPIDRRQVDPAPFYVVWSEPDQNDPHRFPWPYQLAEIEIAAFERIYPHTEPRGHAAGTPARAGYAIFKRECVACHSINGEGGKVGPELNVPQSIVEYRPVEQIKRYVRNPGEFRYTTMPAHPHLGDADLDALVGYFEAMRALKRDPRAAAAASGAH